MSFKKDYSGGGFADRFKIGFKDQIQNQIKECLEAVTSDEISWIRPAVLALQLLVTPRIADPIYYNNVDKINKRWKDEYETQYSRYLKEISKSICPDVIDKPSEDMPLNHILALYSNIQALFERKKLLLESERTERL